MVEVQRLRRTQMNTTYDSMESYKVPFSDVEAAGAPFVKRCVSSFLSADGESTAPGVSNDEADLGSSAFESGVFSDAVETDGFAA
jgi:hypothetical protein